MTTKRIVVETETLGFYSQPLWQRRVLEPGSYVLIERDENGEWPDSPEWPNEQGDGALVAALNTFLRVCWANDGIDPWVASHGTATRGGELSNFQQAVMIIHAFLDALAQEHT